MSTAARAASASTWRLPSRCPVAWAIPVTASSKEPRILSTAASRRSPCEWRSGREVQRRVGRMKVRLARCAIGDPGHLDLAEDGAQCPGVACLDPGPGGPVGADDRDRALPLRAQLQVVLVELAEQLPAVHLQVVLQLGVAGRSGLGAVEEGQHRLEPLAARGETAGLGLGARCRAHRVPRSASSRPISVARPASPCATSVACAAR